MIKSYKIYLALFMCLGFIFSKSLSAEWNALPQNISSVSPPQNALGVSPNPVISVAFDSRIRRDTLNDSTFVVFGSRSGFHSGVISYENSTNTASFTPVNSFTIGETVTAILTDDVQTVSGTNLTHSFLWHFTINVMNGTGKFQPDTSYNTTSGVQTIYGGDFDNDDDLDLALVMVANSDNMQILLNNGEGVFEEGQILTVGDFPRSIDGADFDKDGDIDLVTANTVSNDISILMNRGDGNFDLEARYNFSENPFFVEVNDYNADGEIDIATVNRESNSLTVFFNSGDGTMLVDSTYAVSESPRSLTSGDFNLDGNIDLATTALESNQLLVFLNNGDGTYGQADFYITGSVNSNPHFVHTADVNGDFNLDLVISNRGVDSVLVFLNQGDGSFVHASAYQVDNEPRAMYLGDLDNDIDLDLVSAHFGTDNISVLLNGGTGNFVFDSTYVTGDAPRFIFGGDMDRDGDLDLAVANYDAQTISILTNINSSPVNFIPDSPVLITPQQDSFLAESKPTLSWEIPVDRNGDSLHFRVEVRNDSTWVFDSSIDAMGFAPVPPLEQESGSASYTFSDSLHDGSYNWSVAARDRFAYGDPSVERRFIVDTTPPIIDSLVTSTPQFQPNWFNQRRISVIELTAYYSEIHAAAAILNPGILNSVIINDSLRSGFNQTESFAVNIEDDQDGDYWIITTIQDSAGNSTEDSAQIRLDSTMPESVTASSALDTSASTAFPITWDQANDLGSGVSGYDVRVKSNNGEWQDWLIEFSDTSAVYNGEHGQSYSFEARSRDNVGNVEPFTGMAEVEVYVDTTASDFLAPAAPLELTAGNGNPSPWQNESAFNIRWSNPPDPGGIAMSFYKLGAPPNFDYDTTGSAPARPPIEVEATQEGGQPLYLWLADGNGNTDYRNRAMVTLRYDATPPEIDSLVAMSPDFPPDWYNQDSTGSVQIRIHYDEAHASNATLKTGGLGDPSDKNNIASGSDQTVEFSVNISDDPDGAYPLVALISDSAGNKGSDSSFARLDHTPPEGTVASSPDTSEVLSFIVNWGSTGSDFEGSGLSGKYDVKVRINDGVWIDWLKAYHGESEIYTGMHGHQYAFEAAARDNVGNVELFSGNPETATYIDTTFSDAVAPQSAMELTANGFSPSPWQNIPDFIIRWQNPTDPSGIRRSLYKLGAAPVSDFDTTASGSGAPPIEVTASQEDGQSLYLWLQDGNGNTDYRNWAMVTLRYDATPPVIDSLVAVNPDVPPNWYNQDSTAVMRIRMYFDEAHASAASVTATRLDDPAELSDIPSGINQTAEFSVNIAAASDGDYQLSVTLSDSAANQSISDPMIVSFDATPPAIFHTPKFLIDENQPVTNTVILKDDNRISKAMLFYRQGGKRTYSSIPMDAADDTTFFATIPASEVTARGVDYFLQASDGLSASHSPAINWKQFPHHSQVRVVGMNEQGLMNISAQPGGSDQTAFRMISIPLIIDDPAPASVLEDDLGPYDRQHWRFFRFNTQAGAYNEFPGTDEFSPGKAFWLIVKEANKTIDSGTGISVPADSSIAIPLQKGWNDIGNPFNFKIDWNDISTSTGNLQDIMGPYTYENRWLIPTEILRITPWKGYALYTERDDLSLIIPPIETSAGQYKSAGMHIADAQWQIILEASCQQAQDIANVLGSAGRASSQWDKRDYLEPPPIGSYISLSFPHPDWDKFPGDYTTDFKPQIMRGETWDFNVRTNILESAAMLEIKNIRTVPAEFEIILYDISGYQKINLRENAIYSFKTDQGEDSRKFKLVVGFPEFIDEIEGEIPVRPDRFHLTQNYPNPFNLETYIQYELPQNIRVTLKIFNLLGQEIKTLISENQETGYYKIRWDGTDNSNRVVGSGIYVLKMEAGDFVQTKKIVLLK